MVVLSRKVGESLAIGDHIIIHFIAIRGDKIRVGIEAPNDMPIHRKEVLDLIRRKEKEQEKEPPSGA